MAKLNFTLPAIQQERTPLDVARSYIAAGIHVFPCREVASEGVDYATGEIIEFAEKAPYTTYGLKDATRSTRIIDIWFGDRYPSLIMIYITSSFFRRFQGTKILETPNFYYFSHLFY